MNFAKYLDIDVKSIDSDFIDSIDNPQSDLFTVRLTLIRQGKLLALEKIVDALDVASTKYGNMRICKLTFALRLNILWHLGKIDEARKLWLQVALDSPKDPYDCLALLYYSFIENTSGNFQVALSQLNKIGTADISLEKLKPILDMQPIIVIESWRIWCLNELDFNSINLEQTKRSLEVVTSLDDSCSRSLAHYYLSIGIYHLNTEEYLTAKNYLELAHHHSQLADPSKAWKGRIESALSIVLFKLGNRRQSFVYLISSISDLPNHYGPLGWRLRVAKSLYLHGDCINALELANEVKIYAASKKELCYELWADALILEIEGEKQLTLSSSIKKAEKFKFVRAKDYLIKLTKNNLTPKELNKLSESICIDDFKSKGFTVLKNFFNKDFVAFLSSIYNEIYEDFSRDKLGVEAKTCHALEWIKNVNELTSQSYGIKLLHTNAKYIASKIFEVPQGLINTSIRIFNKRPGAFETVPHQDSAYLPEPSGRKRLTIWLPIDDVSKENGCLYYYESSHLHGLVPHELDHKDSAGLTLMTREFTKFKLDVPVTQGDIIVHDMHVVHGAYSNKSNASRRAFAIICELILDERSLTNSSTVLVN